MTPRPASSDVPQDRVNIAVLEAGAIGKRHGAPVPNTDSTVTLLEKETSL